MVAQQAMEAVVEQLVEQITSKMIQQLVAKAQVVEQLVVQQVVKKGTLKAQEALAPTQLNLQLQHLARFGPPDQPLVPNNVEHSSEPLLHCSPSPSLAEVAQHTWKLGEVLRSQTSGQSKTNQWNRIVFHFSRHKVRLPAKSQVLFFEARQLCFDNCVSSGLIRFQQATLETVEGATSFGVGTW